MSNEQGGTLRRNAHTGGDTTVRLRPFHVERVQATTPWDPSSRKLPVSYDISDPNSRIRNGRIRYTIVAADREVVIHRQRLQRAQLVHGRCYELSEAEQWDGTITEGLDGTNGTENRIGEKVTADLSPIGVIVEVWNNTNPEPGTPVRGGRGRTSVPNEWLSSGVASVDIDSIIRARWDKEWVIPYDDPDEPDRGVAGMEIEVRNVREGTPVRLEVYRIANPTGNPPRVDSNLGNDQPYVDTAFGDEDQPGLQHCVVRQNRVMRQPPASGGTAPSRGRRRRRQPYAPDSDQPYVRFNNYEEHWRHAGNNFYAFRVAFGERGLSVVASERDYLNHESDCLHMRFVVLIHNPAVNSNKDSDYIGSARELHRFFRSDTRYFRSYLKSGGISSPARWIRYYSHRYIVIIAGHAAAKCRHASHPMEGTGDQRDFVPMHHRGFTPDQNCCPTRLETTQAGQNDLAWEQRYYRRSTFAGCGQRSRVGHAQELAAGRNGMFVGNLPDDASRNIIYLLTKPARRTDSWGRHTLSMGRREPRLLFYCGGCRTMLTTNFGECFTRNETQYFHGWTYSVWISENRTFARNFFRAWIKGTQADPAPTEYDLQRFLRTYRDVAGGPGISSFPRIMNRGGMLNRRPTPASSSGALH